MYLCIFYTGVEFEEIRIEHKNSDGVLVMWKISTESQNCIIGYELTVRIINSDNTTDDVGVITIQRPNTYAFVQDIYTGTGKRI